MDWNKISLLQITWMAGDSWELVPGYPVGEALRRGVPVMLEGIAYLAFSKMA
jgi:hypothetical protein